MLDLLKYLLGLGFIGAIVTLVVTIYRARVQPIRYSVDVFAVDMNESEYVRIVVTDPQESGHVVPRFFIGTVVMKNTGNKDYEQFEFRITIPVGLTSIETDIKTPDSSHTFEKYRDTALDKTPQPVAMEEGYDAFSKAFDRLSKVVNQEIDLRIKPFNRGETYLINLTVVPMVIDGGYFRSDSNAVLYKETLEASSAIVGSKLSKRKLRRGLATLRFWSD